MFKVGDYFVFQRNVCKIKEIKKKAYNNTDYYIVGPVNDESLTMQVPTDSDKIRPLISKKELKEIVDKMPSIPIIDVGNDKMLEGEYKRLLKDGGIEGLIKIIKTTYLRNQERLDNNKKIGDRDNNYFMIAEEHLYNEFAIVLNKSYEEAKNYVVDRVAELQEK